MSLHYNINNRILKPDTPFDRPITTTAVGIVNV